MKYEVRCGCGNSLTVTAADAGSSVRCGCGRSVEVPPLHELRLAAGQIAASPEVVLESLLLNHELPDAGECARCGEPTGGEVVALVECERAEVNQSRTPVGCLPVGFGFLVFYRRTGEPETRGRNVAFLVPVRCCPGCAPSLAGAALRTALRRHPVCAGLLDKYPHATVTRA